MHHDTCVTHVPWCMSGSLTCGDGENVPGIPGACAPAILCIWQEAHGMRMRYQVVCMRYQHHLCYTDELVSHPYEMIIVVIRKTYHYHYDMGRSRVGVVSQIAKFMGPMLAPWTLLSGILLAQVQRKPGRQTPTIKILPYFNDVTWTSHNLKSSATRFLLTTKITLKRRIASHMATVSMSLRHHIH